MVIEVAPAFAELTSCVFPSGSVSLANTLPVIVVPFGAELASSLAKVEFVLFGSTLILNMAVSVPPFPSLMV